MVGQSWITVFGTGSAGNCGVARIDNYPISQSGTGTVFDGEGDQNGAPEFISVSHIVGANETYYRYYCMAPDNGAILTAVWNAFGSIDTSNNYAGANRDITAINENFNTPNGVITLGPEIHITTPSQSATFQTRQTDFPPLGWMENQQAAVCNTLLELGSYFANARGCLYFTVF